MPYLLPSLALSAVRNPAEVINSKTNSLCTETVPNIISATATLKPLSTPVHSCLWRKVREAFQKQWLLCKLLLHQKKSWGRQRLFYFTHRKQTNNPQIWNPELTKALNPSGFERGQCFFIFLLCYHYLYNKWLQNAIMSDVGNKLFGV